MRRITRGKGGPGKRRSDKDGPGKDKGSSKAGRQPLGERVRTAKGRKISSTRWLERQINDPYVHEARRLGYRSRAAFKLIELDDRFHFLKKGALVLDLGAAPGGWSQIAVDRVGGKGMVVAVDILEMSPVPGVQVLHLDFTEDGAEERVLAALPGKIDLVLSDMAPPTMGHKATDHVRIISLCDAAFEFAIKILKPGGTFVAKVLQGGTEGELLARMKQHFASVRHAKPKASRSDSAETYVVATGFKG